MRLLSYLILPLAFLFVRCNTSSAQESEHQSELKVVAIEEFKKQMSQNALLIDVRTPEEFKIGHFEGSKNIPLNTIENNINKIKSLNKDIVVVCASGVRSGKAKEILNSKGITSVNGGSWSNLKK